MIPISEIFGPTLQGEGMHIGIKCGFIRVAGCDLKCDWCDTKYAWMVNADRYIGINEIIGKCETMIDEGVKTIILTGGNPLLYDLGPLCDVLKYYKMNVHVETQGTIWKDWIKFVDFVCISPKPHAWRKDIIISISQSVDTQLKVVVFTEQDMDFAAMAHQTFPDIPFTIQFGYTIEDGSHSLEEMANMFLNNKEFNENVRFLPQLHRIIWGNRRGV